MMDPADRDRVFIADLSAESTGLSKPNVTGLGRRGAAHDARLGPEERAVVLVAGDPRLRSPGSMILSGRRDAGVKAISRATCSTATRAFSNLPFYAPIDPEPAEVPAVFIS
jgi:hypothetical protein